MGWRAAATGLLCALLAPSIADADDAYRPTAHLELERGEVPMCPDARGLGDAVAGRLGYDPFVTTGGDLQIRVYFARTSGGLTGHVQAFDAEGSAKGEKKIESRRGDCAEVAEAVTLTIALLLDPRSGLVPRPPPSKAEPDPLEPRVFVATGTGKDGPVAPAPASPSASVVRVRAGLLGTVGAEPAPSIAARGSVGIAFRAWSLDAEFRGDLPREASVGDKRATSGLLLGALSPCLRRGMFEACGVVAMGALRSEVSSSTPPAVSTLHVVAGPRGSAVIPLGTTLALVLAAEALFAMTRTTVRVDGVDVWTPPLLSGGLGVALEVRFP